MPADFESGYPAGGAAAAAGIDDFLRSLRAALTSAQPDDVHAFVRKFCAERAAISSLPVAEQVSLLCRAAAHGDVAELDNLLKQGLNPNIADYDLRTPLHLAAEEMHAPCVELLLARRADVNAADRWGSTPLAGVEALVAVGEDGGLGHSILELLRAAGGRLREEYYLLDGDCTPCERAWGVSHKPLAKGEVLPSQPDATSAAGGGGVQERTLQRCAAEGRVKEVEAMIVDGKVDVNFANVDGRTALHLACEHGNLEVVKFLVERGADVNVEDKWGTTPLVGAEKHSHFQIADYLYDHGAQRPSPKPKPLHHHAAVARRWWNERLCREAGVPAAADVLPGKALRTVLQRDFGFDLGRHAVLEREVRRLENDGEIVRADFMKAALSTCSHRHQHHHDRHSEHRHEPLHHHHAASPPGRGDGPWRRVQSTETVRSLATLRRGSTDGSLDGAMSDDGAEDSASASSVLSRVVLGKLAIGSWESFMEIVRSVYAEVAADESLADGPHAGANADYIPELRDAPPDKLAIAVCTVDGQVCGFGDYEDYFSVQSTGKGFAYTLAMKQHTRLYNAEHEGPQGKDYVHRYVGQEPSGRAFNDFTLTRPDACGKRHPFNPVTNAGAIVTCSMIDEHNSLPVVPGDARSERMESRMSKYKEFLSELCGGEEIGDCMDVFESEQAEAFNNYALANFMRARDTFPPTVRTHEELRESVDFYLRVCSTRVSARLLAAAAATYATFGACPLTGRRAVAPTEAKQTLAILSACGMYDFSGEWACTVGLPAKSGVSGNIFIVVPGKFGLCVWSPRLDALGNSVRGVRMAQRIKEHMSCSLLDLLARTRH